MPERGGRWYGSSWIRPERRLAIYARDGFACAWCGSVAGHLCLDHLWRPVDDRYDNRSRSLVTSCMACNNRRAGHRLSTWLRLLRARGVHVAPIVAELRRRVRAPLDLAEGRRLLEDRKTRGKRRRAADHFREHELPALREREAGCIPF